MRRTRSTGCRRASLIKLMFADDEELVRSGLRGMMSGALDIEIVGEASDGRSAGGGGRRGSMWGALDLESVGEAGSGRPAVEAARRHHPDVALLDIKMRAPDDGI